MTWTGENRVAGIVERDFTLAVEDRTVPGVYWAPDDGDASRLVLLGHGGWTHKKVEYLQLVALALAARGIASMAIDGPGHGDRSVEVDEADLMQAFAQRWESDGGTAGITADWRSALDFVEDERGARPTGWWGLSMGTMMGLPVTAGDERIRMAVLGLMGTWGPNAADLARLAPEVDCPVRFLVQWDDEVVPRQRCLELFDLLGSRRKTLHANPGAHAAVPRWEVEASVDFLAQRLG